MNKIIIVNNNAYPVINIHDFYDVIIKHMGYDAKDWLEGYLDSIDEELTWYKIREEELMDTLFEEGYYG